jgi:hypothetical protein
MALVLLDIQVELLLRNVSLPGLPTPFCEVPHAVRLNVSTHSQRCLYLCHIVLHLY